MMFWIGWSSSVSNRRSRLVTIPTTRQPGATTGSPEMRCCWVSFSTSRTVMSSEIVIGSLTMPLSKRLTFVTSAACARGDMFLWMMPIPPSWAMAIASRASVTVSMADDTTGMLRPMPRVNRVLRLTSRGRTVEWAGTRRTSSKVKAFSTTRMSYPFRTKPALYAGGCKPPTNPCVSRLTLQRKTRKLPRRRQEERRGYDELEILCRSAAADRAGLRRRADQQVFGRGRQSRRLRQRVPPRHASRSDEYQEPAVRDACARAEVDG